MLKMFPGRVVPSSLKKGRWAFTVCLGTESDPGSDSMEVGAVFTSCAEAKAAMRAFVKTFNEKQGV